MKYINYKDNNLFILFFEFIKISLFTIGGGLAMIPLIEETFVKKYKLMDSQDIVDMIAITQTIPGLIAINCAIYVGRKLAGTKGSLIATIGVVLPSLIIIMIIAYCLSLENITSIHALKAFSCVRACVLGLFVVLAYRIGCNILKSIKDYVLLCIFIILLFLKLHPAIIVVICCVAGGLYETYGRTKSR